MPKIIREIDIQGDVDFPDENISFEPDGDFGTIRVSGFLHVKNLKVKAGWDISSGECIISSEGDISSGGSISSEGYISSKGSISSGGYILSKGDILSKGSISSKGDISSKGSISSEGDISSGECISSEGYISSKGSISSGGYCFSFSFSILCKNLRTKTLPFWREFYAAMPLLFPWKDKILSDACWNELRDFFKPHSKEILAWDGWHPHIRAHLKMFLEECESVSGKELRV